MTSTTIAPLQPASDAATLASLHNGSYQSVFDIAKEMQGSFATKLAPQSKPSMCIRELKRVWERSPAYTGRFRHVMSL